jgi:hypothetical protein
MACCEHCPGCGKNISLSFSESHQKDCSAVRAQLFSYMWSAQCASATIDEKNRIGIAYVTHFLGLGEETAKRFAQGDFDACHEVGMKQGGLKPSEDNLRDFWEEMRKLFPSSYTNEDIEYLVHGGGISAVLHFLFQLGGTSPVLHALLVNAHVYK